MDYIKLLKVGKLSVWWMKRWKCIWIYFGDRGIEFPRIKMWEVDPE